MTWYDVDTALAAVPVNVSALIDDTDFKSREESVVYNQAGMDLVWNFLTTAGAYTQTAVVPTTAGVHDWVDKLNAMYALEIPASAGTINNDSEGFGWFTGFATGILPWTGPIFGFRAAALNNALIDGGDNLDVNVAQWLAVAVTLSGGNKPDVNIDEISDDATAPQNLELQYDGTGVVGDEFPATQTQVSGIVATGSTAKTPARSSPDGFIITLGENEVNTEDATRAVDGVTHDIEAQLSGTQQIDVYYEMQIGIGIPSLATWRGYLDKGGGAAKNIDVQVQNVDLGTWRTIDNVVSGTSIEPHSWDLFTAEVGSGGDTGTARIRFLTGSVAFSATTKLLTEQIFITHGIGQEGYELGAIWFDSNASNTSTARGIDGRPSKPVSTMAAVNTLLTKTGLHRVEVAAGSTVTLAATQSDQVFSGQNWTLALGIQNIGGSDFFGADVSGISSGTDVGFHDCDFGAGTYPPGHYHDCGFGEGDGLFTAASAGEYVIVNGYSLVAGLGTPDFTFAGLGPSTGINNRGWFGGFVITMDSDCTLSHEVVAGGDTTIITGGGGAEIRGIMETLTVTMSAAETVHFVGITGPIVLNGTTTATVDLHGVSSNLTDNTTAASVSDETVSQVAIDAGHGPLATEAKQDTAQNDLDTITGSDGVTLATAQALYAPAKAGDQMDLINALNATAIAAIVDAMADEPLTGATHNVAASWARRIREMSSIVIIAGTSPNTGGTTNTSIKIELDGDASAMDGAYDPAGITIVGGTGAGQSREIWEYFGATKLAYLNRDWKVTPDDTSEYVLHAHSGNTHVNEGYARGGGASSITLNPLASSVNDAYRDQSIFLAAGVGADQSNEVLSYDGATRVATMKRPWVTQPANGLTVYAVLPPAHLGPTLVEMTAEHNVLESEHATLVSEHAALPTAVENRQEMDSNSTEFAALRVAVITAATGANVATDIVALKAVVDAIKLQTDDPGSIPRNAAFTLAFQMLDETDLKTPETGLTVAGTRSIDKGAFGPVTGTITEIALGFYVITGVSADSNGTEIIFRFTATGAADRFLTARTSA